MITKEYNSLKKMIEKAKKEVSFIFQKLEADVDTFRLQNITFDVPKEEETVIDEGVPF